MLLRKGKGEGRGDEREEEVKIVHRVRGRGDENRPGTCYEGDESRGNESRGRRMRTMQ